ncbi:unnamed protein product [Diplocarpon coronariae]
MPRHNKSQHCEPKCDGDNSITGSVQSTFSASSQSKIQKGKAKSFYDEMPDIGEPSTAQSQIPAVEHVTKVTRGIIRQFADTEIKLKHVLDLYRTNVEFFELGEYCSDMNNETKNLKITIATLTRYNKKDADLRKKEEILKKLKHKKKKRLRLTEATYETAKKNALKNIYHEMTENSRKQLSNSDARRNEPERLINAQIDQKRIDEEYLKAVEGKNEDLELAKKASESKAQKLKEELERIKNGLGLKNNPSELRLTSCSKEIFNGHAGQINVILEDYCQALAPQDWEPIQNDLRKLDPRFASLPISDSEESRMIRITHTQRIIAFHLYNIVLQQLFSDRISHPGKKKDAMGLLHSILWDMCRSGCGRSGPTVFRAFAMRGLQSMLRDQIVSPSFSNGTKKTRIEAFVESILPSLSLLMKSKYQALKSALVDLANSTVSLWNSAQTEDLEIAVSLDLHVSLHNNWNSPAFDPDDGTAQESKTSSNDPHIYTLFLSINTKGLTLVQVEIVEQEIFIHHGIGMAETSALVLRDDEFARLRQDAGTASKKMEEMNKLKLQRTRSLPGFALNVLAGT